ncbi:MAG: hypothetical protein OXB90_01045 [Acidimicrobiaceae bacterium]|nr:hypothetical protein [Acidimicrobiaceae bacterium]
MNRHLTAIVESESDGYVAFCPEIERRLREEVYVTQIEVVVG